MAWVVTGFLLLAQGAAVSGEFHHWIHDDAGTPHHACAAASLANGQIDVAPQAAVLPRPPEPALSADLQTARPPVRHAHGEPPGRAPPPVS